MDFKEGDQLTEIIYYFVTIFVPNIKDMRLSFIEIFASFMVLFAIIDIPGSIPIILDIKAKTGIELLHAR